MKKLTITFVCVALIALGLTACHGAPDEPLVITDHPPQFVSVAQAAVLLEPMMIGAYGWEIVFANAEHIVLQNGMGGNHPLFLRYNIAENAVDRALYWPDFAFPFEKYSAGIMFWLDGSQAALWVATGGLSDVVFAPNVYLVDFERETVDTFPAGFEGLPSEEERFPMWRIDEEQFAQRMSQIYNKLYNELAAQHSALPEIGFFWPVTQLDDGIFAAAMHDGTHPGFFGSKILVIDVNQGIVLQELALSAMVEWPS